MKRQQTLVAVKYTRAHKNDILGEINEKDKIKNKGKNMPICNLT